jgi:regulator of RNase E activity RraA
MDDIAARLGTIPVPTLISSLVKLGMRTRHFSGLRPLSAQNAKFAGPAFTVRTTPVREDLRDAANAGSAPNLHRQAMATIADGQVMVIDARGTAEVSPLGDIIALYLKKQGVRGVVSDSGAGDVPGIIAVGLPVFCYGGAPVPGSTRIQVVDWNVPIACAGVVVYPGDLIVADETGAVCVPHEHAEAVFAIAEKQEALEAFLIERVRAGAPLATTYPPDAATMAAYHAQAGH